MTNICLAPRLGTLATWEFLKGSVKSFEIQAQGPLEFYEKTACSPLGTPRGLSGLFVLRSPVWICSSSQGYPKP